MTTGVGVGKNVGEPDKRQSTDSAWNRRLDLQGMRAVAVLTVFSNHLFHWPSGGFIGVDVFFVLSGFFITGILIRERTTTRKISFQNFYVRRAKRILPSALLVLVVTVLVSYTLLPAIRARETLIDALYAAVFVSNFRFESVGADYFQQDQPPSPLQHYWSLSIEEQFYFVWPALLVAIFALTRGLRRRGKRGTGHWSLLAAMSIVVSVSFGLAMLLSSSDPNSAYFSTPTRVWELGVGALVAIGGPWLARLPAVLRPLLAYVGLAGVATSLFLINPNVQFPAPWAALPVLSTALVIVSFHGVEVRSMFLLTNPVARWFGDISYTLYLWHFPVIVLLSAVLVRNWLYYVLCVSLALLLTAITYRFYEDPIRKSRWLLEKSATERSRLDLSPAGWALIGGFAAAAVVLSIISLEQTDKVANLRKEADSATIVDLAAPPENDLSVTSVNLAGSAPAISVVPGNAPCFGAPAIINPSCSLRNPDIPLQPSVEEFSTEWGGPSCWTELRAPLKSCTYGYEGPDAIRIALVGDSHAGRVLVGLAPYLTANRWHLTTYIGQGCMWKRPARESCPAMAEIEKRLVDERYDLVLTTSTRTGSAAEYPPAWEPVLAAGGRIAVLADNPKASEQSIACVTRVSFAGDHTGECGTPAARAKIPDPQVDAASRVDPRIPVIDLTPYYCTAESCPSIIGDVIVYADTSSHVTPTFIRTVAPALVNGIKRVLG